MRTRHLAFALAATTLGALFSAGGCGHASAPNPFSFGGGGAGSTSTSGASGGAAPSDAGPDADPSIGAPCVDDKQCDDGTACTFDRCDKTIGRCRFTPDDTKCQNGVYCDGVERCDPLMGCVPGVPVTCNDDDACTVDVCDESNKKCKHLPRDADGDGDPDIHCGGGDCDDENPAVNSHAMEICGNGIDDNCNGQIDEEPCVSPANDTCGDPLVIDKPGSYAMNTAGAAYDYPTSCGLQGKTGVADVVAALELPAGPPLDVEVTATVASGDVSVAIAGQCGQAASEIACGATHLSALGGSLARFRARAVGSASASTTLPIYVETDVPGDVTVAVAFDMPPIAKATNETCGTAAPIAPGVPENVEILDATIDLASMCAVSLGELVYTFTLDAPADVDIYASSIDGTGIPMVSLRDAACAMPTDEITCSYATSAHVLRHSLAAGTYFIAVSASAPTYVDLELATSAPTPPPADETCAGSPTLVTNKTISIDLGGHQDDINTGCISGAADAAYDLLLAGPSDVLLVERISRGDDAAVELALPACDTTSRLSCGVGGSSPLRASSRDVPAGDYRVVVESTEGQPVELTAFVRDALPPTQVLFADTCADAFPVPADGGFFEGDTANAHADYAAGCDESGTTPTNAPDQMLKLVLTKQKRVVLDMTGSAYSTLLDVRKGPSCPGSETINACAVGSASLPSFLDLTLDAGTYYLQVDGYAGDQGSWFLDVRVVDP